MYFASDFALVEAEAAPVSVEAAAPASSIAPSGFRGRSAMMPSRPPPQRQPAPTTNVIQVRVGAVGEPAPLATGDPTICGHCNGKIRCYCLSSLSLLLSTANDGAGKRFQHGLAAACRPFPDGNRHGSFSLGSPQHV